MWETVTRDMFADLVRVHALLRRDLDRVRRLADQLGDGMPADEAGAVLRDLAARSALGHFREQCRQVCYFVHSHHMVEDAALFPALRQVDPDLGPVVDKLAADHVVVSSHLDEVEAAAAAFTAEPSAGGRDRLTTALTTLAEQLLTHLDFEETSLESTLSRWTLYPA